MEVEDDDDDDPIEEDDFDAVLPFDELENDPDGGGDD